MAQGGWNRTTEKELDVMLIDHRRSFVRILYFVLYVGGKDCIHVATPKLWRVADQFRAAAFSYTGYRTPNCFYNKSPSMLSSSTRQSPTARNVVEALIDRSTPLLKTCLCNLRARSCATCRAKGRRRPMRGSALIRRLTWKRRVTLSGQKAWH